MSKSTSRWVSAALVICAAVGVTATLLWRRLEGRRIERESHTVIEAVHKVARLTTVEMNVSSFELRKDAKNLFGVLPIKCEKTVAILYKGKVAAGFDLEDKSGFTITRAAPAPGKPERRLLVELPAPAILYTDAPAPEVVVADGSICNRLEAKDYQLLTTEARAAVQRAAISNGVLGKAEAHARELIQAVARPLGYEAEIRVRTPALSVAPGH